MTYVDTAPLERNFGFKPETSLRDGLRRFAERYARQLRRRQEMTVGHNKDAGYHGKYPKFVENGITLWKRLGEFCLSTMIFSLDAPQFFWTYVKNRIEAAMQR